MVKRCSVVLSWFALPFGINCNLFSQNQSLCLCVFCTLTPPLPRSSARWIWRWLCLARGRIRRSKCPCSGCRWSVSRCCWKLCPDTSTRSRRIRFRLWTSSRDTSLPWGAVAADYCCSPFACIAQFPAALCLPPNFIMQRDSWARRLPWLSLHVHENTLITNLRRYLSISEQNYLYLATLIWMS